MLGIYMASANHSEAGPTLTIRALIQDHTEVILSIAMPFPPLLAALPTEQNS